MFLAWRFALVIFVFQRSTRERSLHRSRKLQTPRLVPQSCTRHHGGAFSPYEDCRLGLPSRRALRHAAGADTSADTYEAIRFALRSLSDHHSFLPAH